MILKPRSLGDLHQAILDQDYRQEVIKSRMVQPSECPYMRVQGTVYDMLDTVDSCRR